MQEIWKDIKDYEGLYQVSNLGNVRSLDRRICAETIIKNSDCRLLKGKVLRPSFVSGYLSVCLCKNSKIVRRSIHRLVAETFIPNPNNREVVNHIDNNKSNNTIDNLEWCTQSHNVNEYCKGNSKNNIPKKVIKKDLNGNIIKIYNSICEASRENNIGANTIKACCRGEYNHGGNYKWDFA